MSRSDANYFGEIGVVELLSDGNRARGTAHTSSPCRPMDPKEGDYVRFMHQRVETTGTVIKRSGMHIRVQPKDGGATLWKELSELLPLASAVDEASEVAELHRLFSSGPSSSARANALSARVMQAAAKPTVSERPHKIGMPTPVPKPAMRPKASHDGDDTPFQN